MHAYDASETFFFLSWPWDPGYEAEKRRPAGLGSVYIHTLAVVVPVSKADLRFWADIRYGISPRMPHCSLARGDGPPLYIVSVAHTEQ